MTVAEAGVALATVPKSLSARPPAFKGPVARTWPWGAHEFICAGGVLAIAENNGV